MFPILIRNLLFGLAQGFILAHTIKHTSFLFLLRKFNKQREKFLKDLLADDNIYKGYNFTWRFHLLRGTLKLSLLAPLNSESIFEEKSFYLYDSNNLPKRKPSTLITKGIYISVSTRSFKAKVKKFISPIIKEKLFRLNNFYIEITPKSISIDEKNYLSTNKYGGLFNLYYLQEVMDLMVELAEETYNSRIKLNDSDSESFLLTS